MTVGELVKVLNNLDPELPVVFQDAWGQSWGVEDMVVDSLTDMETDLYVECAILVDRKLAEV
jgi:hypothetical protein